MQSKHVAEEQLVLKEDDDDDDEEDETKELMEKGNLKILL